MRRLRVWVLVAWLGLTVHPVVGGADDSASPYQPDWPKLAKLILHRSLQLAPGQRVILHYLPGHNPGLVQALRTEVITSGALISAELTWPTQELGKYYETLTSEQKAARRGTEHGLPRDLCPF
jgi:hypothetical protein